VSSWKKHLSKVKSGRNGTCTRGGSGTRERDFHEPNKSYRFSHQPTPLKKRKGKEKENPNLSPRSLCPVPSEWGGAPSPFRTCVTCFANKRKSKKKKKKKEQNKINQLRTLFATAWLHYCTLWLDSEFHLCFKSSFNFMPEPRGWGVRCLLALYARLLVPYHFIGCRRPQHPATMPVPLLIDESVRARFASIFFLLLGRIKPRSKEPVWIRPTSQLATTIMIDT
jgi:hypothetical protein